jgi:arylsulfatase A-like enzyme
MDRGVAALVDELDRLGLTDDTLFMFTSDNGPQFSGSGEYCTDRFNCGFRGAKGSVYEGGVRLPMVMRWPGGGLRTGELHDLVHFTDWLPTLVAVAGGTAAGPEPAGRPLDGVDVLAPLRGQAGFAPTTRFWQWNRYTPVADCNAAVRDGRWKLVRPAIDAAMQVSRVDLGHDIDLKVNPGARTSILEDPEPDREVGAPPPSQLFDLAADPGEEHDVAAGEPGRVARMEADLARWFEAVEADRGRTKPAHS